MRLYSKPTSPYARKVRVAVVELGLGDLVSIEDPPLRDPATPFWRINAAGLVPALITDDGELVLESNVICEYLDMQHAGGRKLFPVEPSKRWRALRLCALGDAVIASQATRVKEGWRPEQSRDRKLIELEAERVRSVLDAIERSGLLDDELNIGHIAIACALSLSDRRFSQEEWRCDRQRMSRWYEAFSSRASMVATYAE